ncbi:probable disease resistance protein At4g27220 [Mangifera indica]|uniref:probable disease resistance protein At4g27220 n=1 Tax=Mangifera indica TaxID=29780 RepID=UPI001CF9976B|nr:probable disease resistance protein At4g27220 [Mangifera indica]
MFTARDLDVLEKMGSINNFKMGILAEKEAWDLFANMAGDVVQTSELNSLANDVCKQCKGLPVVICAIAKALKTKTRPSKWKAALRELRAPSPSNLMENYASISDLFIHVVCLDILEGANLTMEDARDRLDNLVHELKDASLLLGEVTSEYFAMHDVIRDVAIIIAYVDHHVFTTKNDIERDWKNRDKLKKSTRISLPGNSTIISQLWPNDLDCPTLEYFYMPNSHFNIPEDFFKVMPMLKVLNLAGLQQLSLPSSLHLLKNLQTLCLNDSTIKDVAIIWELKKLKVLSMRQSFIEELPIEIGQLTELRLLDLSYCRQLHVIVPNVISKLLQLEEFHIKGCPIQWKVEVLMELKSLKNLTSVELNVKDCKVLPQNLFAKEPRRYKISIGNYWERRRSLFPEYGEHERTLAVNSIKLLEEFNAFKNVEVLELAEVSEDENYVEDSNFDLQSSEITPLFNEKVNFTKFRTLVLYDISLGRIWDSQISTFSQNLKQLKLKRCEKMTYVFPFSIAKSLRQLQSLEIINCEVLEKIVEEEEGAEVVVNSIFPKVTELVLRYLPKLTILYPGLHASEFSMFKRLEIDLCENLTLRYLGLPDDNNKGALPISENKINHNLEDFELTNGEISITWESEDKYLRIGQDDSAYIPLGLLQIFQSVKKLELSAYEYKEIKSVYNLPNLEDLRVWDCEKLMSLVPSSASLQNLKVLEVTGANALLTLITPSTARSLMQLRELRISRCEMLLEIIGNEGDTTTSSEIVFDNLKLLSLTERINYRRMSSFEDFFSSNVKHSKVAQYQLRENRE